MIPASTGSRGIRACTTAPSDSPPAAATVIDSIEGSLQRAIATKAIALSEPMREKARPTTVKAPLPSGIAISRTTVDVSKHPSVAIRINRLSSREGLRIATTKRTKANAAPTNVLISRAMPKYVAT